MMDMNRCSDFHLNYSFSIYNGFLVYLETSLRGACHMSSVNFENSFELL